MIYYIGSDWAHTCNRRLGDEVRDVCSDPEFKEQRWEDGLYLECVRCHHAIPVTNRIRKIERGDWVVRLFAIGPGKLTDILRNVDPRDRLVPN